MKITSVLLLISIIAYPVAFAQGVSPDKNAPRAESTAKAVQVPKILNEDFFKKLNLHVVYDITIDYPAPPEEDAAKESGGRVKLNHVSRDPQHPPAPSPKKFAKMECAISADASAVKIISGNVDSCEYTFAGKTEGFAYHARYNRIFVDSAAKMISDFRPRLPLVFDYFTKNPFSVCGGNEYWVSWKDFFQRTPDKLISVKSDGGDTLTLEIASPPEANELKVLKFKKHGDIFYPESFTYWRRPHPLVLKAKGYILKSDVPPVYVLTFSDYKPLDNSDKYYFPRKIVYEVFVIENYLNPDKTLEFESRPARRDEIAIRSVEIMKKDVASTLPLEPVKGAKLQNNLTHTTESADNFTPNYK